VEYQKYMRAVDVFAQRQSYYKSGRQAKKWWPRLAWFIIDIGIMNAYVLCNINTPGNKLNQKEFRIQLMKEMVGSITFRSKVGRPMKRARSANNIHSPTHMHEGRCTICGVPSGIRGKPAKRTKFGCKQCNVNVCIECFEQHQLQYQ
jgi:hypothetical protein